MIIIYLKFSFCSKKSLCLFFHRSEAASMQPHYGERKGKDFRIQKLRSLHPYGWILSLIQPLIKNLCIHFFWYMSTNLIFSADELLTSLGIDFKLGLSHSKKICFIYFNENPLKLIKNAFYFILKALFVL